MGLCLQLHTDLLNRVYRRMGYFRNISFELRKFVRYRPFALSFVSLRQEDAFIAVSDLRDTLSCNLRLALVNAALRRAYNGTAHKTRIEESSDAAIAAYLTIPLELFCQNNSCLKGRAPCHANSSCGM